MIDDVDRRDDVVLVEGDEVFQHRLHQLQVDRRAVQARERGDADEGALELADVGRHLRGHELEDLVGHLEPLALRLLAQDRDAGLEVGRLHVGDQAPLEARPHPVFEAGEVLRRDVAGDDDLLVVVVQRIEGVEERLLRAVLALQELDVVDQQDVDLAVARLEDRSPGCWRSS